MSSEPLAVETAAEMLSSRRRRVTVRVLDNRNAVDLGDLADRVARTEFGAGYDGQQRKAVYVALYQTHVDRLHDAGIVEYRKERGELRRGPAFETAVEALDQLERVCQDNNHDTGLVTRVKAAVGSGGERA